MNSPEFTKMIRGYGLTTANIFYRLPDHPSIMQSYIWQEYDRLPDFPELHKFLHFWTRTLDGKLHSVMVAHAALIKPAELRTISAEFKFN
jgi:uncharacterized protein Usg